MLLKYASVRPARRASITPSRERSSARTSVVACSDFAAGAVHVGIGEDSQVVLDGPVEGERIPPVCRGSRRCSSRSQPRHFSPRSPEAALGRCPRAPALSSPREDERRSQTRPRQPRTATRPGRTLAAVPGSRPTGVGCGADSRRRSRVPPGAPARSALSPRPAGEGCPGPWPWTGLPRRRGTSP